MPDTPHRSTGVEPSAEAVETAACAIHERWPRLGILSRVVVYRHPTKQEIAGLALTAAYVIDAPAIHAAGVAEGRAAMCDEIMRAHGEGVWHKDGAMAQLRQMAQWARDHNCLAFGSKETAGKIARNVDAALDAIEAAFPTTGEKT